MKKELMEAKASEIVEKEVRQDDFKVYAGLDCPFRPEGLKRPLEVFNYTMSNAALTKIFEKYNYESEYLSDVQTPIDEDYYVSAVEGLEEDFPDVDLVMVLIDNKFVPPFVNYGLETKEVLAKTLISLILAAGSADDGFRDELVGSFQEIADSFKSFKGEFDFPLCTDVATISSKGNVCGSYYSWKVTLNKKGYTVQKKKRRLEY